MSPDVSLFDLVILALIAALAVGGYRLGFVARVLSWVGLAVGIAAAAALAPGLLDAFRGPDPGSNLLIVGLIFAAIASLGGALGATAGAALRRSLPLGVFRQVDQVAGAIAGGLSAVVLVWLLLPAVQDATPEIARQVRNSAIARALDRLGPEAPASLQALRQRVSDANFPKVFDELRPSPRAGSPPVGQVLAPAIQTRVRASTVRVSGTACGRLMEGSGFSPAADTIVTNAHVVAGVRSPQVLRPNGKRLSAQVQLFDPQRDLALLAVPDLGDAPLPVASADVGDTGAVFGHPEGQVEVDVQPYRVTDRRTAVGRDLYNETVTRRDVLFLAARLAPGDSGGALVNQSGAVVGVAFAVAPDEPATAFALSDKELRAALGAPRRGPVSTGPCTG
jgi:S1-C subfamily serine protease